MSKRGAGAGFGGGEERYGGESAMDVNDKPMQATQAQMARRKIAAAKKTGRPGASRGASPFTPAPAINANTPGMFGNPMHQPQAQFSSSVVDGFNFGQNNQQEQQNGGSPAPFQFQGAPTQQNGNNPFAQQNTQQNTQQNSFGSTFNSTAPQSQQNGFGPPAGLFSQPASANTSSFQFSASQPNGTPATATTSTFGSFGQKPAESTQSSQNSAFTFGAQQQEKQNSQTTVFGGFGQTQQAMEKASTPSFAFGQQAQTNGDNKESTPSFGGFSQSQAAPEKASTPSFGGFGQSQKEPENATTSTFGGFGQSQKAPEKASTPSFGAFGQTAPTNGANAATPSLPSFGQSTAEPEKKSNPFSNFGQKQQEENVKKPNPFANFGQKSTTEAVDKPLFGASQSAQETPKATTSTMFGASSQPSQTNGTSKGLFGASVAPPASSNTGGGSIFDSIPKKPSSNFVFSSADPSQVYREEDDEDAEETAESQKELKNPFAQLGKAQATPKPSLFAGLSQPQQNGDKSHETPKTLFGGLGASHAGQSTPSFGVAQAGQQTPKPATLGGPLFGSSTAQANTTTKTPSDKPQQSLFASAPSAVEDASSTSQTPAAKPRSLADRMDDPNEASRKLGRHVSFDKTSDASEAAAATTATPSTARSLFGQSNSSASAPAPPTFQPQSAQTAVPRPTSPLKNMFTQSPAPTPVQNNTSTSAPPPSATSFGQPQPLTPAQQVSMKRLNNMLLNHLKNADIKKDWSSVFDFAIGASASIRGVPRNQGNPGSGAPQARKRSSEENQFESTQPAAEKRLKLNGQATPITSSGSPNLFPALHLSAPNAGAPSFDNAAPALNGLQTPQAAASNMFAKPPATAPQARKRVFEEDDDEPAQPATEKRAKPNEPSYPKLPDTASKTAKLFQATLENSNTPSAKSSGFNPSTSLSSAASPAKSAATPQASQTPAAAPKAAGSVPSGGFTPSGGFKPSGGFAPTFTSAASGGGGFLSSFGAKAKKTEDEERKKRMDEDYDSDDETKEQWEERDRKEQEAKRQKIMDAAKASTGFKLPATASATSAVAASTAPVAAEKSQGSGDNTWKPETPIKFGGFNATASTTPAVPPPSGGSFLFGKSSTSSSLAPPPSTPLFGQKSTENSRGTTPGVTTDGEASNATTGEDKNDGAEPVEDASDRKGEDLGGLLPEEKQDNEVLAELENVKTSKLEETDTVDPKTGKKTKAWIRKASGRMFILKNKATGKTRVLAKAPQGQPLLNYVVLDGMKATIGGTKKTQVMTGFHDHIHVSPPAFGQFAIVTSKAEDAQTLVRFLTEAS
ncbi:unnamed protein product [Zymoseptoria tritici ST99CH_3D7]|uniref:RanBD1 domain-containing protein n=1 Tax=Zymoseptoria tritici (strain ST99CH_3D7) TaxID=1276538 RepID=A0A1X7RQH6_ZYMT9|nr:unnamed protein product [Zymoseptoria tritici ST99CH_3D7]